MAAVRIVVPIPINDKHGPQKYGVLAGHLTDNVRYILLAFDALKS
jgi:hypothetical protein